MKSRPNLLEFLYPFPHSHPCKSIPVCVARRAIEIGLVFSRFAVTISCMTWSVSATTFSGIFLLLLVPASITIILTRKGAWMRTGKLEKRA